jgi:hypothetical protein
MQLEFHQELKKLAWLCASVLSIANFVVLVVVELVKLKPSSAAYYDERACRTCSYVHGQ